MSILLDWLTLGIVSGVWDGIGLRHNAMTDDPSVYNIINVISLGTLDTLRGVVKPEKPWSLEHLLDIVGTVLIAYAAFRTVSKVTRAVGGADDVLNLKPKELMRELANSGEKVDDVVAVTITADGRLVWLETGTEGAGLKHILSHSSDFAARGINEFQIPELIVEAIKNGKILGYQGSKKTRPIYEVIFHDKIQRVAITIGSNGFVVDANPSN